MPHSLGHSTPAVKACRSSAPLQLQVTLKCSQAGSSRCCPFPWLHLSPSAAALFLLALQPVLSCACPSHCCLLGSSLITLHIWSRLLCRGRYGSTSPRHCSAVPCVCPTQQHMHTSTRPVEHKCQSSSRPAHCHVCSHSTKNNV